MEELINRVSQKTGLSQDKARSVVETVIEHLRSKLPASVSSHLDNLMQGHESSGGIADKVSGVFGKKSA
jgi:uncharacterized protein (DUF2267 family)